MLEPVSAIAGDYSSRTDRRHYRRYAFSGICTVVIVCKLPKGRKEPTCDIQEFIALSSSQPMRVPTGASLRAIVETLCLAIATSVLRTESKRIRMRETPITRTNPWRLFS